MTNLMNTFAVSGETSAVVFVNRAAGRGRAGAYLPGVRRIFESHHVAVTFVDTRSAAELESLAGEALARGQRMLLAMGGDGTFQALVNANGVLGTDVTLGILPAGGGNDFAAALGLPPDPLRAAEAILTGKPRFADLPRARTADGKTRFYIGGGGMGLDAEAAWFASRVYRRFPGRLRYIAAALHALSQHRPLRIRLEFPGTNFQPIEAAALLTGILNTPTYGAGLRLAPGAAIDDGLLQAVLIEDLSALGVLKLLPRLMSSGELCTARVQRWTVQNVKISADRFCLFHGDGEILGPAPVEIEVVPRAALVLAPPSQSYESV